MAFRTRDLGPERFAIDWIEVGCFRDITTGEPMNGWFNPFRAAPQLSTESRLKVRLVTSPDAAADEFGTKSYADAR